MESKKYNSYLKFSSQHCWLSLEPKPLKNWQIRAKSKQAKKKYFLWDSCYLGGKKKPKQKNQGPLILPKYNVWLITEKSVAMSV